MHLYSCANNNIAYRKKMIVFFFCNKSSFLRFFVFHK